MQASLIALTCITAPFDKQCTSGMKNSKNFGTKSLMNGSLLQKNLSTKEKCVLNFIKAKKPLSISRSNKKAPPEKVAFFQNIHAPVLASLSWPFGILQKTENLFCRANPRHHKQISHLASKASLSGLFCNFSLDVKLCGGGDPLPLGFTSKNIWIAYSKRLQKPGWRLNP